MKLAEENLWKKFLIIGYGHNLGDLTPKVQAIKEKNISSLCPNSKLFCTETNYQMGERQTTGWKKKIIANHICDKAEQNNIFCQHFTTHCLCSTDRHCMVSLSHFCLLFP